MPRTNFSPFLHGFQFANTFENDLANLPGFGKVATYGRCGGMSYTALDYYFGGLAAPTATALPADGVPLADYIFQRQLVSFTAPSAIHFISWTLYPDEPTWFAAGVNNWTRLSEFPKLKSQLDLGNPQVIGLVQARDIGHMGFNHQVVAYGYDVALDGTISVYIYDCNSPGQETVLTLAPGGVGVQASNKPDGWRGFFVQAYGPAFPPYLLEGTLVKEASTPDKFVIFHGGRFHIPSMSEFRALRYEQSRLQSVPDGSLAFVANAPIDGTLVAERGQPVSYVVYGGAKFPLAGPADLDALGLSQNSRCVVPTGSLADLPGVPRDSTLLRERSQPAVYVVRGGQRQQVADAASLAKLGLSWGNVRVIPDGVVAAIPDGGMLVV